MFDVYQYPPLKVWCSFLKLPLGELEIGGGAPKFAPVCVV